MRKLIVCILSFLIGGIFLSACLSMPSILQPREATADPALLVTMYVQGTLLAQEVQQIRAAQVTIQAAAEQAVESGQGVIQTAVGVLPTAESLATQALSEAIQALSPVPSVEPISTEVSTEVVAPAPTSAGSMTGTITAAVVITSTPSPTIKPSQTRTPTVFLTAAATETDEPTATRTPSLSQDATPINATPTPTSIQTVAVAEVSPTVSSPVGMVASPTPGTLPGMLQPPVGPTPFAPAEPPVYPPPPPFFATPPGFQHPYFYPPHFEHPYPWQPGYPPAHESWSNCLRAEIISQETQPFADNLLPGQSFEHTWTLRNAGECTWVADTVLMFDGGEPMGNLYMTYLVTPIDPGETVEISLDLIAPMLTGEYTSYWIFRTPLGQLFGTGPYGVDPLEVNLTVSSGRPIYLLDGIAQACQAKWSTGQGMTTCGWSIYQAGGVWTYTGAILEGGEVADQPVLAAAPYPGAGGRIYGRYPPVYIMEGDLFDAWIGCLDGFPACDLTFSLQAVTNGKAPKTLAVWHQTADGVYRHVQVDLSSLASKYVTFILSVQSNTSASTPPVGFWMKPVVIR